MSSLSPPEQRDFERLLEMGGGYVLNFTDRSFAEFVVDTVGLDIGLPKYCAFGASKAKRLRAFWRLEADLIVGRLLSGLVEYIESDERGPKPTAPLLGRCRAAALRLQGGMAGLAPLKDAVEPLDLAYLEKQIARMEAAVSSDPALAIGTAKELVESVSKTVLRERGNPAPEDLDLHPLAKRMLSQLQTEHLLDATSEAGAEIVRRILANLASVTQGVGELRNKHGTGHGKEGRTADVDPSLALLAVCASAAYCRFVLHVHRAHPSAGSGLHAWSPGAGERPVQADSTQPINSEPGAVRPRLSS
jgi:hypothetical protein